MMANVWDVSVGVQPGLPVWPGDPPIVLERFAVIAAGAPSNASRLSCSVHTGTHVDAPIHFLDGAASVDMLPLDVLIGPAWVAYLPDVSAIGPDHLKKLGIPAGASRLLIKTRNSDLWARPEHAFTPDFAALTAAAASWLVEQEFRLVGIDYLSVQCFSDPEPWTHRILLQACVVIVEGLDLSAVSPGPYQLVCLPLKLVGSDGAPARVVLLEA